MNAEPSPKIRAAKEVGILFLQPVKVALVWIRYMQVPILAALAACGLSLVAYAGIGPATLVLGAYDGSLKQVFPMALTAVLCGFVLWDISKVISKYGVDRFGLNTEEDVFQVRWQSVVARNLLKALFASVPILTALACNKASTFGWREWTIWGVTFVAVWWGHRRFEGWTDKPIRNLIARTEFLRGVTVRGYRSLDANQNGIGPEHVRQGFMLLLCIVVSLIVWTLPTEAVPAVIYVYLIILGLAWVCSALGFFFWRHHVPLALVLGLWVTIGSWSFHRDYTYRVVRVNGAHGLPTAHEVISAAPDRRIAVAAVGGGIHSGAWAVEVLTRLQEIEGCADFPKRLCAISGTSGGSYGAMHYAHAMYHDDAMMGKSVASGKPGNPKDLDDNERKFLSSLRTAAQAPSLGAVVHSLAYHDLPSYFAPLWWFGSDRGTAMENQWAKNAMAAKIGRGEDLTNVTLAEWGEQAREGNMPAVLFTSGTEESGRPMIYGSSKVLDWNWNAAQMPFRKEDAYRYEDFTVPVITGARLSSSFPFVTPAARPAADAGQLRRIEHQMDGGYYDNYGLVALNRWLEDGLRKADGEELSDLADPPPEFTHILVIQIRYKNDPASGDVKAGGFFYQATAPLTGLYNARVAGQRLRADEQFDTFCRYWKKRGVVIDNAAFEFHDDGQEGAPLSWHLTEKQKSSVEKCGERILSEFGAYAEKHEEITAMNGEDFGSIDRSYPLGAAAFKVREFIRAQQGTGEMMILNPRGNAGE